MTLWVVNSELNQYLDTKASWIHTPLKRLLLGVVFTVLFTGLAIVMLIKLWEIIWSVEYSNYYDIVINALIITFFISLFFHGRGFLMQWKQAAVEAERYQKESMTATYESLKNQVNPHFLFNSLNALTNLVYEDQDKAVKFIKQLSEVYRYVLDTRGQEMVPLTDELKFLKSYMFLQQIRFGEKLSFDIQLSDNQSMVAPLALQMLIENAIKHNEISNENPLHIKIYSQADYILIENNLQKRISHGEVSSGVGLDNIIKRYQFLTDKKVVVTETQHTFEVRLPIIPQP